MNVQEMKTTMGGTQPTAPAGTMTVEQMKKIMNGGSLTPDQSSAALGHSNGLLSNMIGGAGNIAKNVSTGVAQGEITTLGTIGTGIEKGLDTVANMIPGVHADTASKSLVTGQNPALQPQNTSQKVGYTGEKIGEFFIPGGAEKEAVAKGASYIDKLPDLLGMTGKAASAVTGALKTALHGAVSGLSFGGITAAQTGDMNKAKSAAETGAIFGGLTGALETFGSGMSQALNKADFKLSPATEAKTERIATNASKFITDNKIVGSSGTKYQKLNNLNQQFETVLQKSLPKGIQVQTSEIVDKINKNVEMLKTSDPSVYTQARNKADEAIGLLDKPTLSTEDALSGKRSWASMAFKTAKKSKQDPTVSSEGAYAVEQAYQKALGEVFDKSGGSVKIPSQLQSYFGGSKEVSLPDFNKVYSDAINAKNLSFMSQFKSDTGLFGRLFGLWAGESIGQAVSPGLGGKVIGGAAGEIMSSHLPGVLRNAGERILAKPTIPESGAKVIQASQNNPTQP